MNPEVALKIGGAILTTTCFGTVFIAIKLSSSRVLPSPRYESDQISDGLYEDEDGVATKSSQAAFSDREPRLWTLVGATIAFFWSVFASAFRIGSPYKGALIKSFLMMIAWV